MNLYIDNYWWFLIIFFILCNNNDKVDSEIEYPKMYRIWAWGIVISLLPIAIYAWYTSTKS